MQILKLPQGDLSIDTLKSIKRDLFKYSHLAAYKPVFKEVSEYIEAREREERRLKAIERKAS